ncbi:STAS domain-containing protein [Planosporangium sp. 12N6]|uniref:STAS domain-containing protein n=1 Tax=Planosporangium spinosum TaxID=3402278 RepID=UPI003CF8CD11
MKAFVSDHSGSGATIVTLAGHLAIDTAAQMHAVFDRLRARSVARIVVDLGKLTFGDSTGLSALKLAHSYCVDKGGYLRLASLTQTQRQLLAAVGLAQVLPAYRDVATACAGDLDGLVPAPRRESWYAESPRAGSLSAGSPSAGSPQSWRRVRSPVGQPVAAAPRPAALRLANRRCAGDLPGVSTMV